MTDSDPTKDTGETVPPAGSLGTPSPERVEPLPENPEAPAPERKRRDPLPILFGIGVLVLLGAVVFLWHHPLGLNSRHPQQTAAIVPSPAPAPPAAALPPPEPAAAAPPPPSLPASQANSAPAAPASPAAVSPPASQPNPAPAAPAAPVPETPAHADAQPPPSPPSPAPDNKTELAALTQQVQEVRNRLDTLEHQTAPAPPDLGPLTQRVEALEKQAAQPAVDPKAIDALRSRMEALAAEQGTLATRLSEAETRQAASDASLTARLTADEARLQQAQQAASQINVRAERVGRLQAAAAALASGQPLGDLPGAPPALARYRTEAPPTEASLRLAFPDLAASAEAASRPDTAQLPFWQAVKARAESLVTVRRGDAVLVGDPASGIIARAREALDAGDLAGAVAAIASLSGPPAQVFADWLAHAKALIEVRAALAGMALRS